MAFEFGNSADFEKAFYSTFGSVRKGYDTPLTQTEE